MKTIAKVLIITSLMVAVSCGNHKVEVVDNRPTVPITTNMPLLDNSSFISASGKVEAVQNANLSTRMMGFVNNIHVKVGDQVKKGQLLISIHSADISAQKAQASASITEAMAYLKNTEKDYNRFKALFDDNSATQKEMDDMTANFEMAKARLDAANQLKNQANAQLSYSNIIAPFSGIITGKYTNKGAMANPGIPLLSIETPGKFHVVAMVPESEIVNIKTSSDVTVRVKSINKTIKGKVTEISTSAQNTGGQYLVKVVLDTTVAHLLSGMFATVQFPVKNNRTTPGVVLVPVSAIVTNGGLKGIYTVSEQNTAILRWLRLGKTYGNKIEVLSGLTSEEYYIETAEGKLFNGVKVTIQ
jgi:RND family efflux transporter MFP subunit